MVKIILRKKNDKIIGLIMNGHANYSEPGEDVVCAAISSLSQTILLGVMNELKQEIPYKISKGKLSFQIPDNLSSEDYAKVEILLNTLELGFMNMEENYHDFMDITIEEV